MASTRTGHLVRIVDIDSTSFVESRELELIPCTKTQGAITIVNQIEVSLVDYLLLPQKEEVRG